jgi:hypothetical protein
MPCGWGCGANLSAREISKHFTACPKRPKPLPQSKGYETVYLPPTAGEVAGFQRELSSIPTTIYNPTPPAKPASDVLSALRRLGTLER